MVDIKIEKEVADGVTKSVKVKCVIPGSEDS